MRLDPSLEKSAVCVCHTTFHVVTHNLLPHEIRNTVINTINTVLTVNHPTWTPTPQHKRVLFTSQRVLDTIPDFAELNTEWQYEVVKIEGKALVLSWYTDAPDLLALWEHVKATYGWLEDERFFWE